ncbi:dihydrolipoamide dehydrogenase [Thermosporothrix hazakensis]|uniref:Dihydrolipoyl dehydrogenase n=2 Tax=Thermosporothrix TaxID=768650 RepID=A0A326UFC8_THEHA|nr:dihydrolipoyl dehydrogenase [Thermosporothrix hazakensis]PZW36571.1 dihydrolipoamide dehydrogenase [Thermosporothrix hazakensis]BBH89039.1 dihydrolipoyl dehydrogenase [Thermosporothrix sp. COM3]GCE47223.1 dihydrolipoyl dehydrogenase [Thermosporothrix hazakensis]
MASKNYDVAVIGAGPGGYVAAIRAAQLGASVAIVEKQYLGGTCLNVGCIPSKAMLHIAEVLHNMESLDDLGISLPEQPTLDMRKAVAYKDKVVKRMTSGVGQLMKANKIDVFEGKASVDASRSISIEKNDGSQETISADKIILANGSVPLMPPMPGIDGRNVINSDTCWNLPAVPKSLICVGGGVIGVELACMFNAIGTKVTILEMLPNILAPVDDEVRKLLVRILNKRGIEIVTGAKVEAIEDDGDQKKVITTTDKGEQSFNSEYVLMAVSRRANTTGLEQLIEQGLDMDRGRVRVNEKMETNLPGIYAIGDLTKGAGLAHVASTEGEVAAENAMGHQTTMEYDVVPNPIFTFPEIAFVGLTEAQAKEKYDEVHVERFPWAAIGKAVAIGEMDGFTKIITGKYGEILGAHIIGPDATNLISEFSIAMRGELTVDEIIDTIHPHPTLSEGIHEAALAVEGRPLHIGPKRQPVRA